MHPIHQAMDESRAEVTLLLREWMAGYRAGLDRMIPLIYHEMRHLASQQLRGERPDHTLTPTALLHETSLIE